AGLVECCPDFRVGAAALVVVAKADLGVHHDAAVGHALALVSRLGLNTVGFEKRRAADLHGLGHLASFGDQRLGVGQLPLGEDLRAIEPRRHLAPHLTGFRIIVLYVRMFKYMITVRISEHNASTGFEQYPQSKTGPPCS